MKMTMLFREEVSNVFIETSNYIKPCDVTAPPHLLISLSSCQRADQPAPSDRLWWMTTTPTNHMLWSLTWSQRKVLAKRTSCWWVKGGALRNHDYQHHECLLGTASNNKFKQLLGREEKVLSWAEWLCAGECMKCHETGDQTDQHCRENYVFTTAFFPFTHTQWWNLVLKYCTKVPFWSVCILLDYFHNQ